MSTSIPPGSDYTAALEGAAVGLCRERGFLTVTGKAPGEMLNGLITNSPPAPLRDRAEGTKAGMAVYSALLTAKGKMITDLRLHSHSEGGFLVDLPSEGLDGALAHLGKFLPPRLARAEDWSGELALVTLLGPQVPDLLPEVLDSFGWPSSVVGMGELNEGEELVLVGAEVGVARLVGSGDTHAKGWDLLVPSAVADPLRGRLEALGAVPLTEPVLETLRVEKGRPRFGKDMDQDTILVEAGIHLRAIDDGKGCYTGQEVIIRIRDRGQVNKRMMGFLLGKAPPPDPGAPVFRAGREKDVGWITSALPSPAFGQTIALGYLRRGIEPGDAVAVGSPNGPEAQVRALSDQGWVQD